MHPPYFQSPAHKEYTIKIMDANPLVRELTPEEKAELAEMAAALGLPDPDRDEYVAKLRRADALIKSGALNGYTHAQTQELELYPYIFRCFWLNLHGPNA